MRKAPRTARTALGLALGPAVLARFDYALLLPSVRADLYWSFATAGAMSTANALGYLAGAPLRDAALGRPWGEPVPAGAVLPLLRVLARQPRFPGLSRYRPSSPPPAETAEAG